jgi:hypothetical protein
MDPKDNPTNPTPFNGGQAPTSPQAQPPLQSPPTGDEVTIDFSQNTQGSGQPVTPDPTLGTINPPAQQDPQAYNDPQAFGAQSAPDPSVSSEYDSSTDATAPSQQPDAQPVQAPQAQDPSAPAPAQPGQPQPILDQQQPVAGQQPGTTPFTEPQSGVPPHTAQPGLLGADKKTIFILAGVAAVLIIAIAVLIFM